MLLNPSMPACDVAHVLIRNRGDHAPYVMQTLAKVAKLDAVKQQLWGLELAAPAAVGASVSAGAPRPHLAVRVYSPGRSCDAFPSPA